MKKSHILLLLSILIMVSCQQQELVSPEADCNQSVFEASIEAPVNSKVSLNEDNLLLWSKGDNLAIFRGSTLATRYRVTDSSVGKSNGKFTIVEDEGFDFAGGFEIPCNIALYPYLKDVSLSESMLDDQRKEYDIKGVVLPETQAYAENSFADGSFMMVAVTASEKDRNLNFKNVLGALKLQFTGTQTVTSITLKGANGEKLSGAATVVAKADNRAPAIIMADDASTEVILDCGEGVQLNEKDATNFIFALPPVNFENGFTVVVNDLDGNTYEFSAVKSQSVLRSTILRMPPVALSDTSGELEPAELVTLESSNYSYHKINIKVPESVKASGNVIRWNTGDFMVWNHHRSGDVSVLVSNGQKYTSEDITLKYYNWDWNPDHNFEYNPITPGEPRIFVAGEFSWGLIEEITNYSGWEDGYYAPVVDVSSYTENMYYGGFQINDNFEITRATDASWTGAFQRMTFITQKPDVLDGGVQVNMLSANSANLQLELCPDDNVARYCVLVLDPETYEYFSNDLLMNREEFFQWAVTSYFAYYIFGVPTFTEPVIINIADSFYDKCRENTDYYVLITAMGELDGSTQSFQEYVFRTPAKVLPEPEILVTPVEEETTTYRAVFNIKCTSYRENPIVEGRYAAGYISDWEESLGWSYSYYDVLKDNTQFTDAELALINSETGYAIGFDSLDGMTTRVAVLGFNEEHTPNDVSEYDTSDILNCSAVADVRTPWLEKKNPVDMTQFEDLKGEWIATAVLQDGLNKDVRYEHTSVINISDSACDFPASFPSEVYRKYSYDCNMTPGEVDQLWEGLKSYAATYTERRLVDQNRLLCTGWLDDDSWGRLSLFTPYDLFVDESFRFQNVETIYNAFGPKWYIEAVRDEKGNVSLIAPVDANFLPPTSCWSVPFYMAAMEPANFYAMTYAQDGNLSFPVEYDAEKDQITIKPVVYQGVEYYPNIIGIDTHAGGTILEKHVVSEVVLTRKSKGAAKAQSSFRSSGNGKVSVNGNVSVNGTFPDIVYKSRTSLSAPESRPVVDVKIPTIEMVKARSDEYFQKRLGL